MLVKVGWNLLTLRRMAWYPADVQQIIAKLSRLGLTNPNLIKGFPSVDLLKNDPSARPKTELLCKPIRRIMEEKSMTRNHGGGIIGRGIMEKASLRREASGRHLGDIWEGNWEASGRQHLRQGGKWGSRRPWGSRRLHTTIDAAFS